MLMVHWILKDMMKQFWAIILLVICGFNAFSVSGRVFSTKDSATISDQAISQQSDNSADALSIKQGDSDHHGGDCGNDRKNCHQCHLGHCHFVLVDSKVNLPDPTSSRIGTDTDSYTSVHLATLQRPPLA